MLLRLRDAKGKHTDTFCLRMTLNIIPHKSSMVLAIQKNKPNHQTQIPQSIIPLYPSKTTPFNHPSGIPRRTAHWDQLNDSDRRTQINNRNVFCLTMHISFSLIVWSVCVISATLVIACMHVSVLQITLCVIKEEREVARGLALLEEEQEVLCLQVY